MDLSVYSLSAVVFVAEIGKPDPQNDAQNLCIHGCGSQTESA